MIVCVCVCVCVCACVRACQDLKVCHYLSSCSKSFHSFMHAYIHQEVTKRCLCFSCYCIHSIPWWHIICSITVYSIKLFLRNISIACHVYAMELWFCESRFNVPSNSRSLEVFSMGSVAGDVNIYVRCFIYCWRVRTSKYYKRNCCMVHFHPLVAFLRS